jgi:hypothetical protein
MEKKKGYGIIANTIKDMAESKTPIRYDIEKNDIAPLIRKNSPFFSTRAHGEPTTSDKLSDFIESKGESIRHGNSKTDYRDMAKRLRTQKISSEK